MCLLLSLHNLSFNNNCRRTGFPGGSDNEESACRNPRLGCKFPENLIILDLFLRLMLALLIGFAIGFERKMRFKEAGVRTHTIVCIGS